MAGYGGLRFGELTTLRALDVEAIGDTGIGANVTRAWTYTQAAGFEIKAPKNGRRRRVMLPASLRDALLARAAAVSETVGPHGLLFPGPKGPESPFSEGEFRRVFERCARQAGWEWTPSRRTANGKSVTGRPLLRWMNLRNLGRLAAF